MIFEKPSTRTRVSFAVGIAQLGGTALNLVAQRHAARPRRDDPRHGDRALALLDAIVIRTFAQADVEELAAHASIPVINGLTDWAHPCQALADLMTIRERFGGSPASGSPTSATATTSAHSLMVAAAKFGMRFVAATPKGYEPPEQVLVAARRAAVQAGGTVELVHDPAAAARGAQTPLHRRLDEHGPGGGGRATAPRPRRRSASTRRSSRARATDAIVMHCLPAHYGEEVTEDVLHGPQSAAWDQAENRLHSAEGAPRLHRALAGLRP